MLRQRAAAAHQSLQEYLCSRLIAEAGQPTVEQVLAAPELVELEVASVLRALEPGGVARQPPGRVRHD